ncbi:MAG: aldehyde dehydrogenase family protein [Lautropia sp.]|nr:aldehyde dehydrogenase family protein [Lautropia sp.]
MTTITLLPDVTAFLERPHGQFIDGKPIINSTSPQLSVINPASGEQIAAVHTAQSPELDAATDSARRAFRGSWANTSPAQRAALLLNLAERIQQHRESLAQIETLQSGKLINLSRLFEIDQASAFLRHFAGAATRISGETITPSLPSFNGEHYSAFTRREPIGVVAGIVPWNFATMIAIWKIGAALSTGCTIVIKPSEFTPLTMMRIAELAIEAGIPPGVINVVNGAGETGRQLIEHPNIAKVSFTGSVPTGIAVGHIALDARLTRFTLELGGKNSVGFLPDVPVEKIINGVIEAGFIHQGQICAAGERFFVHRNHLDEVLEKIGPALNGLKIGNPLDEDSQFGPLANKAHLEKVGALLARARTEASCEIIHGGAAIEGPGYYFSPTVLRASDRKATLLHEETFGPVATFMAYDNEEDLMDLFNDTPFGLSASLWTNDLSKALNYIPKIEAGTVWVNMHNLLDPAVPFGGIKQSGLGREFGSAFIDDYTELKSVFIRH